MKKASTLAVFLLMILILLFCGRSAHAAVEGDSTITVSQNDKLTLDKVYEDVKAGIQGIAKALRAPAEHVYYILVKQQIVKAVVGLVAVLSSLTVTITVYRIFTKSFDKDVDGWLENGRARNTFNLTECTVKTGVNLVLSIIFLIITLGLIIGHTENIITGLINPEYGAIKDITEFIR